MAPSKELPKLPPLCTNTLYAQGTNLTSDSVLGGFETELLRMKGDATQANCLYTRQDPLAVAIAPSIDDPAKEVNTSEVSKLIKTNSQKYGEFRGEWGAKAVMSGLISPVYFDTYKAILGLPLPPDNISKAKFEEEINLLAYMIKVWYVNARYAGNLAELAVAIDRSKPEWTPPDSESESESFMNYAKYENGRFKEAAIFAGIVGLGLAGYCFWKACK